MYMNYPNCLLGNKYMGYQSHYINIFFVNIGKFRRKKHYTNKKFNIIKRNAKYEMVKCLR